MGRAGGNNDDERSAQETLSFAEFVTRRDLRPGPESGCAVLLLGAAGEEQQFFPLIRNPTVIGRSSNADLVLQDPTISDYHARVLKHTFGYTVEDMGSAEGTFLRDRRINHARLSDGDVLRLGSTVMTFVSAQASVQRVPPKTQQMMAIIPRGTAQGVGRADAVLRVHYSPPAVASPISIQGFDAKQIRSPEKGKEAAGEEESGPSLEDILRKLILAVRYLRTHAYFILAFAAIGLALGAASFRFFPPVRIASCTVTLFPAPKINPIDQQGRPKAQTDAMTFFVGVDRAFLATDGILATLRQMGVPYPTDSEAERIAKRLRFESIGNNTYIATLKPNLFDRRDDWHVRFLDARLKNYVETEIDKTLKVFVAEVDFLRSQTEAAERKVQEVSEELVKFREAHSDQILAQSALASSPAELESRRIALAGQISRLTGELDGVRSQLTRGSALSQARAQSAQSDREAIAGLDRKLAELRAQGFADGHPEVERILTEKRAMQKAFEEHLQADVSQFEKRSNVVYDGLQAQSDNLQAQIRATRSELGFIEANRRSLRTVSSEAPKVNARLDELLHDKDDAIKEHGVWVDRLRKAEVQLQLERISAASRYEIISPARLEFPPGRKAFLARIGIGLGIGLLVAGLLLGLGELKRLFVRVARGIPATIFLCAALGALLTGCAHEGSYVWAEDLPVKDRNAEPIINPRDTLLIEVQKQPSLSGEFVVRDDGHYSQPMAGSIYVAHKTPREVAIAVSAALRDVVVTPAVSVWISKTPPIKVSVVGEVKTPGTHEITRDRGLITVLALAGWVSEFAHSDRIFVLRAGSNQRIRFRLQDITDAVPSAAQFQLADADVVIVE